MKVRWGLAGLFAQLRAESLQEITISVSWAFASSISASRTITKRQKPWSR